MHKNFSNYTWGEIVPEGGVELENRVLYQYMKDGEQWYTEYVEDTGKCIFHNPINTSAYGLLFHKSEEWLLAVIDKMQLFFNERNLDLLIDSSYVPIAKEYCISVSARNNETVILLSHQHGDTSVDALRKCLVMIVKYLTTEYN